MTWCVTGRSENESDSTFIGGLRSIILFALIMKLFSGIKMTNTEKGKSDGIHRGATQKVHGSANPAPSGSQSTGAIVPSAFTIAPGAYAINNAGNVTYTVSQGGTYAVAQGTGPSMTMPGSTPGYMLGYGGYGLANNSAQLLAQAYAQAYGAPLAPPAPKVIIKNEGIRMGEIVAYRCWPIKNGFLWSTAAGRAWAPGEPMKADANHIRGGLGVYAFKEMSRCIQEFGNENFHNEGTAFGSVHLWGEIVEHERGYRAEYAAIRSIEFVKDVPHRIWTPHLVGDLRKLYKVEPHEVLRRNSGNQNGTQD